jgi:hypothetical protein
MGLATAVASYTVVTCLRCVTNAAEPTPLVFVLALIESGVSTPYELQKMAGLSPGATIPVLQKLLDAGFVRQLKTGSRGRVGHQATATGRKFLSSSWRTLIDDGPSGDLDADLRVALLAVWVGCDRRLAVEFLRQSADRKLETVQSLQEKTVYFSAASLAGWYSKMRSASAQALLNGESNAASSMAEAMPRSPKSRQPRKKIAAN